MISQPLVCLIICFSVWTGQIQNLRRHLFSVSSEVFGTGDYRAIHIMFAYSVANDDHCIVVLEADESDYKEEAAVEPTQKPTEKPTQVPTQIPTQGPTYSPLNFKDCCSSMTIFIAVHYLNFDGDWTTQGWFGSGAW